MNFSELKKLIEENIHRVKAVKANVDNIKVEKVSIKQLNAYQIIRKKED